MKEEREHSTGWLAFSRGSLGALLFLAVLFVSGVGRAQPTPADRAAAEALFEQGLAAMEANNAVQACPKFEESQRLDPGVGTLLYLADCYQTVGRTASAWATFLQAAYAAKDAGQLDRQQTAEQYAARLKPQLSMLLLRVSETDLAGLTISNDEQEVRKPLWGSQIPVDPGQHTISAQAPGRKSWTGVVEIPSGPSSTTFDVPALEVAELAPSPPEVVPSAASTARPASADTMRDSSPSEGISQSTWGWIALGGGGLFLAGSGVVTVLAALDNSRADDACRRSDPNLCSEQGVELSESAATKANVATVLGGVGAAAAAAGLVLILTAPDEDVALEVRPDAQAAGPGLVLKGSF